MTIIEFLTARFDEAESGWRAQRRREDDGDETPVFYFGIRLCEYMLREVAAKRRILALHGPAEGRHPDFCGHDLHQLPCQTLRLLASVYADAPGFAWAWRL